MTEETTAGPADIQQYLTGQKAIIDRHLDELLPTEETHPSSIHRAMRYSLLAGGKRIRPIFSLATGEALGTDSSRLLDLACALEMIHTYSLIHDDLPAMDDDDYRRGQPTLHKKFGEAVALLAGNALLTLAFRTLTKIPLLPEDAHLQLTLIDRISQAVGTEGGMLGGQILDLASQGKMLSDGQLQEIHMAKTGALISVSVCGAALLSQASEEALERLEAFGWAVGLAFQIADDLLDAQSGPNESAREMGRDGLQEKATYPGKYGLEASRRMAQQHIESAIRKIEFLGSRGETLRRLAQFVGTRRF